MGVKLNSRCSSSAKMPTLASARMTRYSDAGCVLVNRANSSLLFGPSLSKSAMPSFAAT
jgi:hypothetical protein